MSAADRAAEVLHVALRGRGIGATLDALEPVVTALMADPDLLVDLTVEAGGLADLIDRLYFVTDDGPPPIATLHLREAGS